jgi:hypothetical protein
MAHTGEFYKQTKNINMKQLLSLFLFLVPCLALAQYPSNGNQKVTLGEQTTADGLIFRGVAETDTVRKPSIDTMAYIVLDTTTNIMWHYKKATSNAWLRLNLLPSDTASMLTPYIERGDTASMLTNYWRSGRFSGVLPLLNGGTGSATQNFVDLTTTQTVNGAKTFNSTVTGARFDPTSSSASGNGMFLPATNTLGFSTNGTAKFLISPLGYISTDSVSKTTELYKTFELGKGKGTTVLGGRIDGINQFIIGVNFYYPGGEYIKYIGNGYVTYYVQQDGRHEFYTAIEGTSNGNVNPIEIIRFTNDAEVSIGYGASDRGAYKLQVNSQIYATNATIATSDIRFKENIQPLDKGLEIINKLKPVKFNYITTTEDNFSEFDEIGFIAQDVEGALSTELFAKAVVKKLDEGKDDSALGLMTEKFIPILVKAIQEQQALIKALEQRIINLENK